MLGPSRGRLLEFPAGKVQGKSRTIADNEVEVDPRVGP